MKTNGLVLLPGKLGFPLGFIVLVVKEPFKWLRRKIEGDFIKVWRGNRAGKLSMPEDARKNKIGKRWENPCLSWWKRLQAEVWQKCGGSFRGKEWESSKDLGKLWEKKRRKERGKVMLFRVTVGGAKEHHLIKSISILSMALGESSIPRSGLLARWLTGPLGLILFFFF